MTEGLLGVNAREVSALFIIDYFRSGTGLPNLASDQKDSGPIGFTRDTCTEQDGQFSMICFMVGYAGREWSKCKPEEQRRQVAGQIRAMFGAKGGDVPEPRKILLQDWTKEGWIWGAPCPVLVSANW
jgi:hypothetical protein